MGCDPGWRTRSDRHVGKFGRGLACLAAVIPALLITQLVTSAAWSSSLINVGPRLPTNIGPRTPMTGTIGPRFDPTFHTAPGGDQSTGDSADRPPHKRKITNTGGSNSGGSHGGDAKSLRQTDTRGRGNILLPPLSERRYFDEIVVEFAGNPSEQQLTALANRLRFTRLESRRIALLNTTIHRWRVPSGSSVPDAMRAIGGNGAVRVQPNYVFTIGQAASGDAAAGALPSGDPAQYALAKLRLAEAHNLAHGDKVLVAVVDSGIDAGHPELAGVVEKSFDALDSKDGPHSHGTGIAGIIAAHARLLGVAPAVHILAARAFSATQGSTFSIVASIDWAAGQSARIINMSFAGPSDPVLGRTLTAARQKGVLLIAAAGNAGPKSPPLWPAADPNVIAVTATDVDDHLYAMANRGAHVAIAAPGVDILVPVPGEQYEMKSGTSFAAAYVSGIAALMLERKPQLTPDAVKKALLSTARDLGPKGRDEQFGAGLADAFEAVTAVEKPADAALHVPAH